MKKLLLVTLLLSSFSVHAYMWDDERGVMNQYEQNALIEQQNHIIQNGW